ncbi:hypothetical protein [Paraburkholderia atlantica]|uniref:hypothetical protein n=1 Tax=Paraburkholderia atlantica TaxID=2654982 RepID=UPI0020CABD28|nr:hypothetical protein [Paraburkholderia atlantica]
MGLTMGAAMRIRTCVESWRSHRAARCDAMCEMADSRSAPVEEAARHSRAERSAWRALRKTAALATIVVATLLEIHAVIDASNPNDDRRSIPTTSASRDCSARYAAMLDLAELARRDGKSSEVVVRGLSEKNGAMSECLPAGRVRPASQLR